MCSFLVPLATMYCPPLVEVLLELRLDPQYIVMCALLVPQD
jgi:hypothetical protein